MKTPAKVLLGILLALVSVGAVKADTISFDLYQPNAGICCSFPAPFASITISVPTGGGAATVTVVGLTAGGFQYELSSVGLSTTQQVNLSGFSQAGFSDGGSGNQDGFGTFSSIAAGQPGSSAAVGSVEFTATGANPFVDAESVLAPNSDGLSAVAHIYVFSSDGVPLATGFAANGTGTDAPTPEPGTLALFGSGLLGLAALVRRRISLS